MSTKKPVSNKGDGGYIPESDEEATDKALERLGKRISVPSTIKTGSKSK